MEHALEAVEITALADVQGGSLAQIGYGAGYGAGFVVTHALAPFNRDLAFSQVGGPLLRRWGFPNAAAGAEHAVRDVAASYGETVRK